jgi:hypothetical protein
MRLLLFCGGLESIQQEGWNIVKERSASQDHHNHQNTCSLKRLRRLYMVDVLILRYCYEPVMRVPTFYYMKSLRRQGE